MLLQLRVLGLKRLQTGELSERGAREARDMRARLAPQMFTPCHISATSSQHRLCHENQQKSTLFVCHKRKLVIGDLFGDVSFVPHNFDFECPPWASKIILTSDRNTPCDSLWCMYAKRDVHCLSFLVVEPLRSALLDVFALPSLLWNENVGFCLCLLWVHQSYMCVVF
jgi:hypothetical protein